MTRWLVVGRRPATETPDTDVEEPANFSLEVESESLSGRVKVRVKI